MSFIKMQCRDGNIWVNMDVLNKIYPGGCKPGTVVYYDALKDKPIEDIVKLLESNDGVYSQHSTDESVHQSSGVEGTVRESDPGCGDTYECNGDKP